MPSWTRTSPRHPQEPLPYAMRASAYLFQELDRLGILESEFFSDDQRIAEKKKLKPDQAVRATAVRGAGGRADARGKGAWRRTRRTATRFSPCASLRESPAITRRWWKSGRLRASPPSRRSTVLGEPAAAPRPELLRRVPDHRRGRIHPRQPAVFRPLVRAHRRCSGLEGARHPQRGTGGAAGPLLQALREDPVGHRVPARQAPAR